MDRKSRALFKKKEGLDKPKANRSYGGVDFAAEF
jgi:hypothetical protein